MSEINVSLINGPFSLKEGEKVIRDVIASKIAFHQKKRLSTLINHQTADDFSDKRIRELTQEIEVLTRQLSTLSSNSELIIQCDIKVRVKYKEE